MILKWVIKIGKEEFGIKMKTEKLVWATKHVEKFLGFQIFTNFEHNNVLIDISQDRKAKLKARGNILCKNKEYKFITLFQWQGSAFSLAEVRWPLKSMVRTVTRKIKYELNKGTRYHQVIKNEPLVASTISVFNETVLKLGPMCLQDYSAIKNYKLLNPNYYDFISFTDASDEGYGGIIANTGDWFFGAWNKQQKIKNIDWREAITAVSALNYYKNLFFDKKVLLYIDNKPVHYGMVNKKYDNIYVDIVIQKGFEICINHKILFLSEYLTSDDNWLADDLSRFRITAFKRKCYKKRIKIKTNHLILPLVPLNANKFNFLL